MLKKRVAKVLPRMGKKKKQIESSVRRNSVCVSKEEKTFINCFFSCGFGVKKMFWKRQHNTKKCIEEMPKKYEVVSKIFLLPDVILELCLNRVPLESLKNARLVCKKWSSLITNPKLIHMRKVGVRYQNMWLFVFRTPYYSLFPSRYSCDDINMIHALDLYRNQWHSIDASFLKGRIMFSIASLHDGILIVGGNSKCRNRCIQTTHREMMFYSAATKSWRNMPSMKYARSLPVLGVTEDPIIRYKYSSFTSRKKYIRRRRSDHSNLSSKSIKRSFLLISIGGFNNGSLCYGEMYDSLSNEWTEISSLPLDFGVACSGTFCGSKFYVCSRDEKLAVYDIEKGFWIAIQTYPPFAPNLNSNRCQLISSNDRLFVISSYIDEGCRDFIVRKLWEFDLIHLTWTEISHHLVGPVDGKYQVFASYKNLIFGIDMMEDSDKILDYFTVGDVSKSNVNWNDISTKYVCPKPKLDVFPLWIKSMVVVHVNI